MKFFPVRERLASDIPAGGGINDNLFDSVMLGPIFSLIRRIDEIYTILIGDCDNFSAL
jgi:hypothetical protein